MSEVEQTCRICRGEATSTQPLIHPCKCRGSIKFIHQDCLLEWLNHSSNKEKRCDICNTAYQFKTIYDPEMPSRMPSREIYHKLVTMAKRSVVRNTSILLYCIAISQLSIFWKFMGRLLTYIADEKLTSANISVLHTLLYGAYATRTRSGALLDSPDTTFMDKCLTFLVNTFVHGNIQVIIFTMVLVVIFIEHEWVIREEGYKALLLRRIGKRPRTKLADLLALLAKNESGENPTSNEIVINRALEDLRRMEDGNVHEHALRAAIEHRQFDILHPRQNPPPALDMHMEPEGSGLNADDMAHPNLLHETQSAGDNHSSDDNELHDDVPVAENVLNLNDEDMRRTDSLDDYSDGDEIDALHERGDIANDELDAADFVDNGNLWEVLGFRLDIITPIHLAFFADSAIFAFLIATYLMPQTVGKLTLFTLIGAIIAATYILIALSYASAGIFYAFISRFLFFTGWVSTPMILKYAHGDFRFPPFFKGLIRDYILDPIVGAFLRVFDSKPVTPPNLGGRVVALCTGYLVICLAFHNYMTVLVSGDKPVVGTPRKVYEIMFQITSTAKVFTIFASEIVLFPLYCGWLIDFCIAPLINKDIVSTSEDHLKLHLLTCSFELLGLYTKILVYWVLGTCYMFCVALFVSMIRRNILRPGVLYFIKSPEDPNTRLIHDAIVKPFFLQVLRIFLSAKVYTAFVVLGMGSVTWGLRFLVNPPFSEGALLPIQISSFYEAFAVVCTAWVLFHFKDLMANNALLFWKHSFAVLSHKFRLSHFLLDEPVPQERGYVVYKSFIHKLLGIGTPDYSKPVSYSEARELFQTNLDSSAYFVPDGTYIRAPSSDDNSRKFLRLLFVPVTKSDQLISPIEPVSENEESDWWDENAFYEDHYTIVYTPPNNKLRCLALVCMVILFGALLIVLIFLLAALVGRPIVGAYVIVRKQLFQGWKPKLGLSEGSIDWKYLDVYSLCAGLITLAHAMFLVDHRPNSTDVRAFVMNQGRRAAPVVMNFAIPLGGFVADIISVTLQHLVIGVVHLEYISEVEKYFLGQPTIQMGAGGYKTNFSWPGVFLNASLLPFTIFPLLLSFYYKKKKTTDTWISWLFLAVSPQTVSSLGIIYIHRLYLAVAKNQGAKIDQASSIYLCIGALCAISITHTLISVYQFLNHVNEQIRNEKYVRGTAIQNIDISD